MSWHASTDLIHRYAAGALSESRASSLEAHLASCDSCRGLVQPAVPGEVLERMWHGAAERIDTPRPGWLERLGRFVGLPDHVSRLVAVTPALRASYLITVVALCGVAVFAARGDTGTGPFMLGAPLVPLAGVALAFAPGFDPTHEIGVVTPLGAFRILLYRVIAVSAASLLILGVSSVALPGMGIEAAGWLLPALALASCTLTLGTRFSPMLVAVVLAFVWFGVIDLLVVFEELDLQAKDIALGPGVQVASAIVLLICVPIFMARRHLVELPSRGVLA